MPLTHWLAAHPRAHREPHPLGGSRLYPNGEDTRDLYDLAGYHVAAVCGAWLHLIRTRKVIAGVITGRLIPRHLQIAYGRHIFALLHLTHAERANRPHLFLRDAPLSVWEHPFALESYHAECRRTGRPQLATIPPLEHASF